MQIKRDDLMKAFSAFTSVGSGVVIGPPGVGKTFVLKDFCSQLIKQNMPCLYLPIDKLGIETEAALKDELGIKSDFVTYLSNQKALNDKNLGILVIDAFDAARSEIAQKFFLSLIRQVISKLQKQWNVIVSVRTYDAKKSEDLQDLFPKLSENIPPAAFQMEEIRCRHFSVPKLTNDEVKETVKTIPHLSAIYEQGSSDFKELLRIPFNLWLLEKLLSLTPDIPELSSVSSEVQLLGLFWKYRVIDGPLGEEKGMLLTKVIQKMVELRSLSVRKDEVYVFGAINAWNLLLSSEILIETSKTAQRVTFSHNILFDYAVSVLLIEDDPDKCIEFVMEDPSRPLFLRPSLNYYFTRLWHATPDLFWKAFWRILPSPDVHLRLFARLIPTTVIVNEAREIEQLSPLLDSIADKKHIWNEAVLRLLQALRTLEVARDELWVKFLVNVSEYLQREFAWDLALVTSDILDRALKNNNPEILQNCGQISRNLLEWIWKKRKEKKDAWTDSLGAAWAVPLVSKTFGTNPGASRILLEKVLQLTDEKNFPINFLYRLTDEIDKVWLHDPDFVASIYKTVFSYQETSQEQTHMGGIVLSLTSTRRQDYEMCQYQLVRYFPHFLRESPLIATQAVIECLNYFIREQHIIGFLKDGVKFEDLSEKFQFQNKWAYYTPDGSYSWDESEYPDEPIKMVDELFKFIEELASSQKLSELKSLLDVFRDKVIVAFFWRRLLDTAAKMPKVFSSLLFELCISRPIQIGAETIRELGVLLEASATEFTIDQLRKIEESIMTIPEDKKDFKNGEFLEHVRDRLLARIPPKLLTTDKAKKIREEMEKACKVPENRPIVTFSSWSETYTEEKWLREKGADLERPENKRLQKNFAPLDKFISDWQNGIPTEDTIKSILSAAKETYDVIKNETGADKIVLNAAVTKLASCAEKMSRGMTNIESEEFHFCREILLLSSEHDLPEPNPEFDSKYNHPHWSPAPRNEAAQGLPWLALRKPDDDVLSAIEKLVHDKVPSVRFLITTELWRISEKAPELFWRLVLHIAENETNRVVQQSLCNTLGYIVAKEEVKTVEVLNKLIIRVSLPDEDSDFLNCLVSIIMWLALVRENAWAIKTSNVFLSEPGHSAKSLRRATFEALRFMTPQKIDEDKEVTERANKWLSNAISASEQGIKKLRTIPNEQWVEETRSKLRDVYSVIDSIIMRLYFAADVRDNLNDTDKRPVSDNQREKFYFEVKPLLEQVLAFTQDKENGIMFASTAHHFMELLNGVLKYDPQGVLHMAAGVAKSSEPYSYNLDSLAISQVVKLVEAILADYRSEVRDGEPLRDLLNLLDTFAKAGWPDALKLVWRLDEVFR